MLLSSRHHEATTGVAEKEQVLSLAANQGTAQAAEASKQSTLILVKDTVVLAVPLINEHFSIHFRSGGLSA